jgi:CubicO group peptidase (beta-lactamase class C family)
MDVKVKSRTMHAAPLGPATRRATGNVRAVCAALLLAALLAATACSRWGEPPLASERPEALDDGWAVSTLGDEGLDARQVAEVEKRIQDGAYGQVHSCLIVRNGKLVYERYFHGFRRDSLHRLYSVTKSVTSALVGIAIEQGLIGGVDEQAISYFPEYRDATWDPRKDAITLEHLLTMSSGLQFDEWSYPYGDDRNSYTQMTSSPDWIRWGLQQPLVAEPGTRFAYSSANTHVFAGILYKTSGLQAAEFAQQHLFAVLGISDTFWYVGDGLTAVSGAYGGLTMRARDMAKFGYLYLQGGRWNGQQVVPRAWVEESVRPHIATGTGAEYGYFWWIHRMTVGQRTVQWFAGRGYADQILAVFPNLDLVVVMTCGNESGGGNLDDAVQRIARAVL